MKASSSILVMAVVGVAVAAIRLAPPAEASEASSGASGGQIGSDFDGDGFADLAVGVPWERAGGVGNAGAVNILRGSPTGLSSLRDQFWTQDSPGVLDGAQPELFGRALVSSDFDGDGYLDLAVGVPSEGIDRVAGGGVSILYGSSEGLTSHGDQLWTQGHEGMGDDAEAGDYLGASLAAGDMNGDEFGDLAIGAPYEDVGDVVDAGAINVLYGSSDGLAAVGNQVWTQDTPGVDDQAELGDAFGQQLAVGDLNGDGIDDLAVGAPLEDVGAIQDAGAVGVFYGSGSGLVATADQTWTQDSLGVEDTAQAADNFGGALTTGDMNGDGVADLAIGVPLEDVGAASDAGAASVLFGSLGGLSSAGNEFWTQDNPGVPDQAESGEILAWSLSAADFDGDTFEDLAMGVIYEADGAGAVLVLHGSIGGLVSDRSQLWTQSTPGIRDVPEPLDEFGASLRSGDYDGDGFLDLAIGVPSEGVPFEHPGDVRVAGAVHVLFGSAGGLTATRAQFWHQNVPGILSYAEPFDRFGTSLA